MIFTNSLNIMNRINPQLLMFSYNTHCSITEKIRHMPKLIGTGIQIETINKPAFSQ